MITTFLDRLGSLVSRQFVVAYFIPVLVFGLLNALLLGWQVEAFRAWAPAQFQGFKGLYVVPILLGGSVIAYLLFSVNVYLRQVLEGRRLLPRPLVEYLAGVERERHDRITDTYYEAVEEFESISASRPDWRRDLKAAAANGEKRPQPGAAYPANHPAAAALAALVARRRRGEPVRRDDLDGAVNALSSALATLNRGAGTPDAKRLTRDYLEMLGLLDDAERGWDARRIATLNRLEMEFGPGEPRPTRMGNVAAALEGYAQTRYRMNLDTFWNRMQPALQKNEKFFGMLTETKTQLDFLVASCWLCLLTGAGWVCAIPWLPFSWPFYLVVVLGAPALARFFYQLALENYVVFTDVVRSAVDLFRFQLLKDLHLPLPTGIRAERALWTALQDLSTFGKEGLEIGYEHEKP
jgi:hypothetical protein